MRINISQHQKYIFNETYTKRKYKGKPFCRFLASLQDRHNERYSKHEAFCYLLDKACERYLPKSVKKEVADLMGDFQFITTKTQLAEDWHWHRATVRQFLEKLTEHGLINCKEFDTKYTIITMYGMEDGNVPIVQDCLLEPIIRFTIDSWLNGSSTTEETAVVCGQIVKGAVALSQGKDATSISSDKQLQSDDIATSTIGRLVDSISLIGEEEHSKHQLRNAIFNFFAHVLNRDWLQLLLLIKELPDITGYGKAASIKLKTAEDMSLFQSLCSAYKVCCSTSTIETAAKPVINAKADNHK